MDDAEARFQQVYDDYHAKIYRYLKHMVGEGEAEDLTQEVFVKIGRALETFRGESRLSTWVYRIATNAALDRCRSSHSDDGKKLPVDDISETEEDKDVWTGKRKVSSEDKVIRQEMNECIREIIEKLPDAYRSVIVLSEFEGLKDSEIAEISGLGLQATKIRIHRARARLKSELTKACVFYRDEQNELACDRKGGLIEINEGKSST
jgi:RNA polymerase sigma-70 factor, ECF subfamily